MELIVPTALDGERADRVVAIVTGLARADAAALVADGRLLRNGRVVTTRSTRVHLDDHLEIEVRAPARLVGPAPDGDVAFGVVYADEDLIVVDKPAGLVVHPGSGNPDRTLVNGLLARFPDLVAANWPDPSRPGIVHRIDKGTSGLLVVARTTAAMAAIAAQVQAHLVERRYVVLAWGSVEAPAGVIDAPVGRSTRDPLRMAVRSDGRRAVTRYDVVRRFEEPDVTTQLSCRLETGRTHQIRVHLAAIGHPVVGDDRYRRGRSRPPTTATLLRLGRPFLHAEGLSFDHPRLGHRLVFEAPLPPELTAVLEKLS